jgi:hypothetical protein
MKTTIEIADELLRMAKQRARQDKTTIKSVLEQALRLFLSSKPPRKKPKIKPVVVKGNTPPEAFRNLHQLILKTYEEREAKSMGQGFRDLS